MECGGLKRWLANCPLPSLVSSLRMMHPSLVAAKLGVTPNLSGREQLDGQQVVFDGPLALRPITL